MKGDEQKGEISRNLFTLQLQIKTLLEGAGGDEALEMLDELSILNSSEQKLVLRMFSRIVSRILSGEIRLSTSSDEALKRFENELFESIMNGIENGRRNEPKKNNLQVLSGGKSGVKSRELNPSRRSRDISYLKPVMN